jgi:hypothetical protein
MILRVWATFYLCEVNPKGKEKDNECEEVWVLEDLLNEVEKDIVKECGNEVKLFVYDFDLLERVLGIDRKCITDIVEVGDIGWVYGMIEGRRFEIPFDVNLSEFVLKEGRIYQVFVKERFVVNYNRRKFERGALKEIPKFGFKWYIFRVEDLEELKKYLVDNGKLLDKLIEKFREVKEEGKVPMVLIKWVC